MLGSLVNCIGQGLQLLANVQRELRADQLVLPLACSEYSLPLQGLISKEGDHVGVKAGDEHEQPPAPRFDVIEDVLDTLR